MRAAHEALRAVEGPLDVRGKAGRFRAGDIYLPEPGEVLMKLHGDDAAFFAVSSLERDVFVLTTSFNTYLTRPISSGTIRAEGRVLSRTRSQFIAEAVAYGGDGKEIARGTGAFVRSKLPLAEREGYGEAG